MTVTTRTTAPAVTTPSFATLAMTTSLLRFDGPSHQSRIQLVSLLREFPQVRFQERAPAEYEVTAADEAALRALAVKPGWILTGSH